MNKSSRPIKSRLHGPSRVAQVLRTGTARVSIIYNFSFLKRLERSLMDFYLDEFLVRYQQPRVLFGCV